MHGRRSCGFKIFPDAEEEIEDLDMYLQNLKYKEMEPGNR